jgi:serpin B
MHRNTIQAITRRTLLPLAALSLVAAAGCRDDREITSAEGDMAVVVEGNNRFAVDMYQANAATEGNLFFSPFSIDIALSMVYAGAEGETEAQIATALGVDDEDTWHDNLAALTGDLCGEHHRAYSLYAANGTWGQEGVPFLDDFAGLMDTAYGAPIEEVDFMGDADGVTDVINSWVSDETRGAIDELFEAGDLDAYTRLVLANAIYFEADWATQFDKGDSYDQDFTLVDGSAASVPMMHATEEFGFAAVDGARLLEMPYEDEELSMVVVLPDEVDGLADLEASLTAETLADWIAQLHTGDVITALPTVELEHELPLQENLEALGMVDAFDALAADFTGIVDAGDMAANYYVSAARHKAYVKVDEEGTVAAAATGLAVSDLAAAPSENEFIADHPFIFLIRDMLTDTILFMGRVEDPRG